MTGTIRTFYPSCAVCQDLLERWAHHADSLGEDPHWPGDAPCSLCPRRHLESDRD